MAAMALLDSEAEMLTARAIDLARDGDMTALKLVLDRLIPPRRRPMLPLDLDELEGFANPAQAHRRVLQSCLDGGLGLDEAERLSKLVDVQGALADMKILDWRAQRYLTTLLRRCLDLRSRLEIAESKLADAESKRPGDGVAVSSEMAITIARGIEGLKRIDRGYAQTLFVAALAYRYDCRNFGEDAAWSRLPAWEQERVREAAHYFPFIERGK
jgi:hypothetical protein